MKFALLGAGKAAEHPIEFSVINGAGETVTAKCLVRPLSGTEESKALQFASEHAVKHGATDAKDGNALFDLGFMVKACQIACVDPDSPESAREPFFASPDEVLALPRETIAHVYELQQHWQDMSSPVQRRMSGGELLDKIREIAESESELPFLRLSPALRWICLRSMAALLLRSPEVSSHDSSSFERSGLRSSTKLASEDERSESEPSQ